MRISLCHSFSASVCNTHPNFPLSVFASVQTNKKGPRENRAKRPGKNLRKRLKAEAEAKAQAGENDQ